MRETGGECAAEPRAGELCLEELNREGLERWGRIMDQRPVTSRGRTPEMALAEKLLRVRTRAGKTSRLKLNAVQRAFEERRGERNIVLKARQMGLTTWAAARFFLKTITHPGTLTLQVAHTQAAAEEIFQIVHRFVDWLPEEMCKGPLTTSRTNVRQICVSGDRCSVPRGFSRRPERGPRIDSAESALLGAGAMAGRSGGDAGWVAGGNGTWSGADSGVDAGRGGRVLLRRVAEGR